MKRKSIISIIAIFIFVITLSFVLTGCGDDDSYRVIKLISHSGTCNVIRDNNTIEVTDNQMSIKNNDELDVKANSNALLKLDKDKYVCVKENSQVKFVATGSKDKTKTRLHVKDGGVIVEVKEKLKKGENFEIASSNSVMAIRGTQISFDVEKTTDTITSTFSILKGNTEIFLYRDETMNYTTLIKEEMMSYTTSLIKSTDEIYKIYDSGKHSLISDDDLYNIYGVSKRRITSKKINEMVDVVNDFEKAEDEIVNGVIEFNFNSVVRYNDDIKSKITILDQNKYTDMKDITYSYATTIDGEYTEYDSSNPLLPGTYYMKLEAGNAYRSDPIEFTVAKALINASMDSQVPYGDNVKDHITITGTYQNLKYMYRDPSNDAGYVEYNDSINLPRGTYYFKVENDLYSTNTFEFSVTTGTFNISLNNDTVAYGTNPKSNITTDATQTVTYKYSKTINGTYKEYSALGTLSVGTWYVQGSVGSSLVSNKVQFEVVPATLNMELTSNTVTYGTNPNTIINVTGTYSNIVYLYSDSENGEFNEFDSSNPLEVGTWYVKADSNGQYISNVFEFEVTQKTINYSIEDEIPYGTNPSSKVTLSGTYPTITYLYSDSINGTYSSFNTSNPLTVGTYYIKLVINDNYTCEIQSFDVVQVEIKYSFTSTSVEYGANPNTIISVNGPYSGTIKYTYCASETGTYTEFNASSPLSVGTYYVKLTINDNYYSTPKQFSVTKKLINYVISDEITYGDSILDEITINGTYGTINYYYSTSSSFTTSNTLTEQTILNPGTYYVKLTSGTNYESEIKSFEIVPIMIDYRVASSVEYGTDPNTIITVSGSYSGLVYMYSQTENGTYREFSPNDALNPGTWYVKLSAGAGYSSVAKSFTVTKATLDFGCNTMIKYGEDLYDNIEVAQNVDIYYSTSLNGTYTKYNVSNPLAVGTYYIYLENDYYISGKKEIEIFDMIDIMLPINVEPVFINGRTCLKLTIGDNEFFNSSYAQIKESGRYKYYILAQFIYGRDGEHQDFVLDYETRSVIYTDSSSHVIDFEFHLPDDVFNVMNDPRITIDTYDALVQISNVAVDPLGNVYARIDESYTTIYWATIKAYYKFDNGTETEVVLSTEGETGSHYNNNTGELVFNVGSLKSKSTLTVRYTYEYDDVFDITFDADTYVFTLSNLNATANYSFQPSNANSFATFNNDGTINAYYDLGFVNRSNYNLGCEVVYGTYGIESETDVVFTGTNIQFTTSRFLACENLPVDNYAIYDYRIVNYVDGLMYILYRYSEEEDFEPYDTYLIYYNSNVITASFDYDSYEGFDVQGRNTYILDGTDIKVYVYEYNDSLYTWELVLKATFDEFKSSGWSDEVLIPVDEGSEEIDLYATYTQVTVLNKTFASSLLGNTYTSDLKLSTDAIFNQVKEAMESTYNITIKGKNTFERTGNFYFSTDGD